MRACVRAYRYASKAVAAAASHSSGGGGGVVCSENWTAPQFDEPMEVAQAKMAAIERLAHADIQVGCHGWMDGGTDGWMDD